MPKRAVVLPLILGGCLPLAPPPPPAQDSEPPAPAIEPVIAQLQKAILEEANAARTSRQLPPLTAMSELDAVALTFAAELARRRTLSHESEAEGMATLEQRLVAAGVSGWRQAGENLAQANVLPLAVAPTVVRLWLGSANHRENLLEPRFNRSGVGVARAAGAWYVVQVYVELPGRARDMDMARSRTRFRFPVSAPSDMLGMVRARAVRVSALARAAPPHV